MLILLPLGFSIKSDNKHVKCVLYPCKTNKNTKLPLIKKEKKKNQNND